MLMKTSISAALIQAIKDFNLELAEAATRFKD